MKYPILLTLLLCSFLCDELSDTITCINSYVSTYKGKMSSQLFDILVKAFPNTMSTTVQHYNISTPGQESTYIITGDIQAMWLRDSTNQFIPYIRMPNNCSHIPALTRGILNTQAEFLMVDAYTNAFKRFEGSTTKRPSYLNDISETLIMGIPVDLCRKREFATQQIWERKWEVDSPSAFLRLAHEYYQRFNKIDFLNVRFFKALTRILTVFDEQRNDSGYQAQLRRSFYTFKRSNEELPGGVIKPSTYTGMIKTGFRPSDSPNQLPFNIPGNAMAASYLALVANDVLSQVPADSVFKSWSRQLSQRMLAHSDRIRQSIYDHGVVVEGGVEVFAYQVDGLGSYRLYDDSNLPCLLSLAYLKFVDDDDTIYRNTRKLILSQKNKYFYARGEINGVGSSHTDQRYIWPLALTIQILTSRSDNQIRNCLASLVKSAKDNLMHESFSVDDPTKITRDWFAWANSFFGEMIMHLAQTNPKVLF